MQLHVCPYLLAQTHKQTHCTKQACLQLKSPWPVVDVGEAVVLEAAQNLRGARVSIQGSALHFLDAELMELAGIWQTLLQLTSAQGPSPAPAAARWTG